MVLNPSRNVQYTSLRFHDNACFLWRVFVVYVHLPDLRGSPTSPVDFKMARNGPHVAINTPILVSRSRVFMIVTYIVYMHRVHASCVGRTIQPDGCHRVTRLVPQDSRVVARLVYELTSPACGGSNISRVNCFRLFVCVYASSKMQCHFTQRNAAHL